MNDNQPKAPMRTTAEDFDQRAMDAFVCAVRAATAVAQAKDAATVISLIHAAARYADDHSDAKARAKDLRP